MLNIALFQMFNLVFYILEEIYVGAFVYRISAEHFLTLVRAGGFVFPSVQRVVTFNGECCP